MADTQGQETATGSDTQRPAKRPRPDEEPPQDDAQQLHSQAQALARQEQPQIQRSVRLEPSYFGVTPHDDFTREVGYWLWSWARDRPHVEIEAKIGILMDSTVRGRNRFNWPIANECIITDQDLVHFASDMTSQQHVDFNALLNSRVEEQASPAYRGARIRYSHTREIDYFHKAPPGQGSNGKYRVTYVIDREGKRTLKEGGVVEKARVANMNIFSPKQPFDFRISINTETPAKIPDTPIVLERFKDRISYTHQILRIDLTKVSSQGSPPSHEIEIEFRNIAELMAEGAKAAADPEIPNVYFEMIQVFLNTVRMIIKNSGPP